MQLEGRCGGSECLSVIAERGQHPHRYKLHGAALEQGLQERQGAAIQKRGLGKRRRGERELEAIPNPWPGPRGSGFGARSPTRFSGERLPGGCFTTGCKGPMSTGAGGHLISAYAARLSILSGAPRAQTGHPSLRRGRNPSRGCPHP